MSSKETNKLIVEFYQDLDNPSRVTVEIIHTPEILRDRYMIASNNQYAIRSSASPQLDRGTLWVWGRNRRSDDSKRQTTYTYDNPKIMLRAVKELKKLIELTNKNLEEGVYGENKDG